MLAPHMLPQSAHRQLVPNQLCFHTLRPRRVASLHSRAAPLVRCQANRGARQDFQKDAQDFGKRTQQDAASFWERTNAQERAQAATKEASKRLKSTFQSVSAGVKKTANQVNSRFDLSGKAQQTADRVKEQLEDVDDKLQLRRKARNTVADVKRQLPQWRRQYNAFSKTLPGKVLWIAFLIWGFRSGLFFRLLNILSILFWLAPLIILPLARKFSQQAAARQQAQQQAEQQAQNPFQTGRNRFAGFGQPRPKQQQQGSINKQAPYGQQDGPVIDAEWTTIDEGDN